MGRTAISTSVITTTPNETLPAEISALSAQYGLTVGETHDVQELVAQHQTNLPTITRLLDEGLTLYEVTAVYDTRDRLNVELESSVQTQTISLTAIVAFQRNFPELPFEADCLVEHMLELHESTTSRYFSAALQQITDAAGWYQNCFAATLAAFMNGELEEPDDA